MCHDLPYQHIAIPFYANLQTGSLGLDSIEHCFVKPWFAQHEPVQYQFNSLGYRTHPVSDFERNAVLVLGDSFTLGLGTNIAKRYTEILEQNLNHQVLNFSLNGASNDWIYRKLCQLMPLFKPRAVVLHYTFSHRRERPHQDWHDDERTECEPIYSSNENFLNWTDNFQKIFHVLNGTPTVHSWIPAWHDQPVDYSTMGSNALSPITQIDFARDGYHYGPLTHVQLANQLTNLLVHV